MENTVNAIENATKATNNALKLLSTTYNAGVDKENRPPELLQENSSEPIINTSAANTELNQDDEMVMHTIAHKKVRWT